MQQVEQLLIAMVAVCSSPVVPAPGAGVAGVDHGGGRHSPGPHRAPHGHYSKQCAIKRVQTYGANTSLAVQVCSAAVTVTPYTPEASTKAHQPGSQWEFPLLAHHPAQHICHMYLNGLLAQDTQGYTVAGRGIGVNVNFGRLTGSGWQGDEAVAKYVERFRLHSGQ